MRARPGKALELQYVDSLLPTNHTERKLTDKLQSYRYITGISYFCRMSVVAMDDFSVTGTPRRMRKTNNRVKEDGSNRYKLAPSLREKPTNIPEIEKLIQLKKSMTGSVLEEVSAMSSLQHKIAIQRRIRKQQEMALDSTEATTNGKKNRSKPSWNGTNTVSRATVW